MSFLAIYHRILDFFIRRIFAVGAVVVGTIITLANMQYLLPGGAIPVNGVPTDSWLWRVSGILVPLALVIFGVVLFRAKPLKPWRGLH